MFEADFFQQCGHILFSSWAKIFRRTGQDQAASSGGVRSEEMSALVFREVEEEEVWKQELKTGAIFTLPKFFAMITNSNFVNVAAWTLSCYGDTLKSVMPCFE